ncbi:MAG: hypothetical protein A2169_04305 [Deltaproteobacteria bacterium RBG_13_47_9]|nr:MAG: hypothetical protein A2169_04305 [Deltaproteobacteria bacterium RBG_13_47_9]
MFERMAETGLPILLSTGMSPLDGIDAAVERIKAKRLPLTVLQCTSMYPTLPEKVGLNLISFFRERYGCRVGLSDHSGTIYAGLAAAVLGIDMLEVHITFSREMFGPDVPASVTTAELRQLVEGVRFITKMRANPVDKNQIAKELNGMRKMFNKSIALRKDLPAGMVLAAEHLTGKKPGTGIPVERIPQIVGRKLVRDVNADALLQEDDLI